MIEPILILTLTGNSPSFHVLNMKLPSFFMAEVVVFIFKNIRTAATFARNFLKLLFHLQRQKVLLTSAGTLKLTLMMFRLTAGYIHQRTKIF